MNVYIGKRSMGIECLHHTPIVIIVIHEAVAHFEIGKLPETTQNTSRIILCKAFTRTDFIVNCVIGFAEKQSSTRLKLNSLDAFTETSRRRKSLIGEITVEIYRTAHLINARQSSVGFHGIDSSGVV